MSDGKTLSGQQYDPRLDAIIPFTERVRNYSGNGSATARVTGIEGTVRTDINPMDEAAAKVRTYNVAAAQAVLDAVDERTNEFVDLSADLPPILAGLVVTYNTSSGSGTSNHPAAWQYSIDIGTSVSYTVSPRSRAQGSAAILPDLLAEIEDPGQYAKNVPAVVYRYFASTSQTLAQALVLLTTRAGSPVLELPHFKPKAHTFVLRGEQVSLSSEADTTQTIHIHGSDAGYNYMYGNGVSVEVGLTTKTVRLPPTIHGLYTNIGFGGQTTSVSVDVEATAKGVGTIADVVNDPPEVSRNVSGTIYPTTLPATSPAAIPTTGLYLVRLSSGESIYGRVPVRAAVVNFNYFA